MNEEILKSQLDLSEVLSESALFGLQAGMLKQVLVLGLCEDGTIRASDSGLTVIEAIDLVDRWLVSVKAAALARCHEGVKRFH